MKSFNEWRQLKENEDRFKGYSWVDDLDQGSEKMGNLKPYSFERLSSGRFAGVNFKGEVFVSVDFFHLITNQKKTNLNLYLVKKLINNKKKNIKTLELCTESDIQPYIYVVEIP